MKHLILGKLKNGESMDCEEVLHLFEGLTAIDGIDSVRVLSNCINRENRFDIMIEITMDPTALPLYDRSEVHHIWKERYCQLLEKKAIFDYEE